MTRCRHCHRDHDPRLLCRGVSRRAFFFFGAAAAAAAFVPAVVDVDQEIADFVQGEVDQRLGKGVWKVLKHHPDLVDRVKFESSFAGAMKRKPIDWAALRRSGQVDPVLTQISIGYNPGGPDYALAIQESADGRNWSKLEKPTAGYRFAWEPRS